MPYRIVWMGIEDIKKRRKNPVQEAGLNSSGIKGLPIVACGTALKMSFFPQTVTHLKSRHGLTFHYESF